MSKQKFHLSALAKAILLATTAATTVAISTAYAADDDAAVQAALNASYDDEAEALDSGEQIDNEGNAEVYDLGRSVITASGFAQDLREAPASMSIITHDEIVSAPAQDIGSIVANQPGIEISKSKTGVGNVMVRGFSSYYTAFLIDGKRQNSSTAFVKNGFDPNFGYTPPASMIERVEIIRGPASTLYGSDAVGGVINVITKSHPERVTGSVSFETLQQEHRDFGNAYGTNGSISVPVIDNKLSLNLRGRYYNKEANVMTNPAGKYLGHSANDYYLRNVGGRITYSPVKDHDFYFDAEHYAMTAGSMNTSSRGIKVTQKFDKDQFILNYDGKYDFGKVNSYLQYYNHDKRDIDYKFFNRSYVFETKAISPINFANGQALNLTYGYQFFRDEFRDDASLSNTYKDALAGNTLDHDLHSLYTEGEYFLTDDWIATLGARYTYSDIFGSHVTPRGYLVYKATDALTLKGGIAAGYKTPAAKELTDGIYNQNNSGANPIYGTPNLKPETSVNYELSVMYELPRVGSVTVTGFLTDFKDKLGTTDYDVNELMPNGIVCTPDVIASGSKCSIRNNQGKTRSRGMEVLFTSARFNNFKVEGSYTYTDHRYRDGANEGEYVSAIPRHSIMTKLSYDRDDWGVFLKGVGKYRTPYISTRGGASYSFYKNYFLLDLGGHYNFTPNSRLNLTINNLLDFDAYDEWDVVTSGKSTRYNTYYRDYIEGRSIYLNYTYDF